MKTIPNLKFAVTFSDRPNTVETVKSLLVLCLDSVPMPSSDNPQGGFTYAIMRARNKVFDALDKVKDGDKIVLEDADFETAKKAVADRRWMKIHQDLTKFADLFGA